MKRGWRNAPCPGPARRAAGRRGRANGLPAVVLAWALVLALQSTGCAVWGKLRGRPDSPPAPPAPLTVPAVRAAADSAGTPAARPGGQSVTPAPSRTRTSEETKGEAEPAAPVFGPPAPAPPLSIDLPEADKIRLLREIANDLSETEAILAAVSARPLDDETAARIGTISGLSRAAAAAQDRGAIQAAANLARKARLLAGEMASR